MFLSNVLVMEFQSSNNRLSKPQKLRKLLKINTLKNELILVLFLTLGLSCFVGSSAAFSLAGSFVSKSSIFSDTLFKEKRIFIC